MSERKSSKESIPVKIYDGVIIFLFCVILSFLVYLSATSISAVDGYESTSFLKDSPFFHIIILLVFSTIIIIWNRIPFLKELSDIIEKNNTVFNTFRIFLLLCILILSVLFVTASNLQPVSDQKLVQNSLEGFVNGDYSSLAPGGYINTYPNQLGLVWISYLFFRIFGFGNYIAFQLMNTLCLAWFYKKLADITGILCGGKRIPQIGILIVGVLFFPLQIYCTFVYGTIPGLALSAVSFYHALLFYKNPKKRNCFISVIAICLAMLFKQNYLIFFIALFLHSVIAAIRYKKRILFILPVVMIIVYPLQSRLPSAITSTMTGITPSSGASSYSWIAMGLQESDLAEGWYNGYNVNTFKDCNYDSSLQSEIALEEIKNRISHFAHNPYYTVNFFTRKLASEWNDPTFESYWIMRTADEDQFPSWLKSFTSFNAYFNGIAFLSHLQFLILCGALLFMVIYERAGDGNSLLLAITILGGFFFHIFWEGKSQYTLPYFILLLPLAILGYSGLIKKVSNYQKEKSSIISPKLIIIVISLILFCLIYKGTIGKNLTTDNDAYRRTMEREYGISD